MTNTLFTASYAEENDLTVEDWVGDIVNELPQGKKIGKEGEKSYEN